MARLARRILHDRTTKAVERSRATRTGQIVSVNYAAGTCLVNVYGDGKNAVLARLSSAHEASAPWLRRGSLVVLNNFGVPGRLPYVSGPGTMAPPNSTLIQFEEPDAALSGAAGHTFHPERDNELWILSGRYRIDNVEYTLREMTLERAEELGADLTWGWGLDIVAEAVDLSPSIPEGGGTRIDIVTVDTDGDVAVVQGTLAADGVRSKTPATPAGRLRLAHVMRRGGEVQIPAGCIQMFWGDGTLVGLDVTVEHSEMSWAQKTSTVTVRCVDSDGNQVEKSGLGYAVSMEFTTGNGEIRAEGFGASRSRLIAYTGESGRLDAVYERDRTAGDVSPEFAVSVVGYTGITTTFEISLLDPGGSPM